MPSTAIAGTFLCSQDRRFSCGHDDLKPRIKALFELCRTQMIQDGLLNWGHTYGNAFKWLHSYKFNPGEVFSSIEGHYGNWDPAGGPSFPSFGPPYDDEWFNKYTVLNDPPISPIAPNHASATIKDVFRYLPVEIRTELCLCLSPECFANLRLASRPFASMGIPAAFWRAFFSRGERYEFLREVVPSNSAIQWRLAYLKASAVQARSAVMNRRRIWNLAAFVSGLVDLRLASTLSTSHEMLPGRERGLIDRPFMACREGEWPPEVAVTTPNRPVSYLSFYQSSVTLPRGTFGIFASTVDIAGNTYISGLVFSLPDGDRLQLGYLHLDKEVPFIWEKSYPVRPSTLVGFHVASDCRGIRGLSAICDVRGASCWIGDQEGEHVRRETNIRGSHWDRSPAVRTVAAHSDALLLVNLSLTTHEYNYKRYAYEGIAVKPSDLAISGVSSPMFSLLDNTESKIGRLWRFCSSYWRCRLPYSSCMFGGLQGELLSHLRRVTVWSTDHARENLSITTQRDRLGIRAIEFHYDCRVGETNTMILGAIPRYCPDTSVESYSFSFDLEEHETIVGFDALYERSGQFATGLYVDSLVIRTSHRQKVELPPRHPQSTSPTVERFHRPRNGTIVGLFCMMDFGTSIKNLGRLCDCSLNPIIYRNLRT